MGQTSMLMDKSTFDLVSHDFLDTSKPTCDK